MPEGPRKLLDASALLAYLQREPGFEAVREALREGAAISAVNLAEVAGKLKARGKDPERIVRRLVAMGLEVLPFTLEEALEAGALDPLTRPLGLSLGDRACLAAGKVRGLAVLTADRTWAGVDLGIPVKVVRP
ncbi:PIN domain-containing protein (plasmid) [Thermus thermophilus]|uniref:type II toxin-antitoxin system VapC family toxin n=1 Tax=Thermus thermophilus TaxID=274 RepID=UPI0030E1E92D